MIFINCCQGELQLFSVVKAIAILCAAFTRACLLAADNSFANDRRNRNWRAHPAGRKKYIIGPLAIYGIQRSARPNLSYGELCDMIHLKAIDSCPIIASYVLELLKRIGSHFSGVEITLALLIQ